MATKTGADAIINVRLWTKSKKSYTDAEFVKFATLAEPSSVKSEPQASGPNETTTGSSTPQALAPTEPPVTSENTGGARQ